MLKVYSKIQIQIATNENCIGANQCHLRKYETMHT